MRTGISLTPLFARYLHVAQYGLAALAAFLVATVAPSARGEVVVNAIEAGGDVVIFGEGSLNLGAWTPPAEIDGEGESARLPATSWSGPLRVPQACFVTPTR